MSKNLLSLILTVVLALASGVWAADPSRPNAIPSAAPRATAGIHAQSALGFDALPGNPNDPI